MTTFGVTWIYVLILQPFALLQILPFRRFLTAAQKKRLVICWCLLIVLEAHLVTVIVSMAIFPSHQIAYWLLGFWLILPVSALLCTFWAAYRALPRYGLMPVFVGLWAIVLPLATFRSTEMQSLFYGLVPSLVGLTLGVLVRKFVFWYRNR